MQKAIEECEKKIISYKNDITIINKDVTDRYYKYYTILKKHNMKYKKILYDDIPVIDINSITNGHQFEWISVKISINNENYHIGSLNFQYNSNIKSYELRFSFPLNDLIRYDDVDDIIINYSNKLYTNVKKHHKNIVKDLNKLYDEHHIHINISQNKKNILENKIISCEQESLDIFSEYKLVFNYCYIFDKNPGLQHTQNIYSSIKSMKILNKTKKYVTIEIEDSRNKKMIIRKNIQYIRYFLNKNNHTPSKNTLRILKMIPILKNI